MKKYIFTTDYVLGNIKIKKGQILDGVEVKDGTFAKPETLKTFVEFVDANGTKFQILTQSEVAKIKKPPFDVYAPKDAVTKNSTTTNTKATDTKATDTKVTDTKATDTKVADTKVAEDDDKIFGIKKTYFYIGVALLLVGGYFGYQKYIAKK